MRIRSIALAIALLAGTVPSSWGQELPEWTFVPDPGVRIPTGVSPEAIVLPDGSIRLYVTGAGPRGTIGVFRSGDGVTFAPETATVPDPGYDPAIVALPDGRLRMYYIFSAQPGGDKELRSALSSDGLRWVREPGTRLENAGLGVPAVVPIESGWRLYLVDQPRIDGLCHCIVSYVTEDGVTLVKEEAQRMPDDFVDPELVQLSDDQWLMAAAKFERRQGVFVPRQILLAYSSDLLGWAVDLEPLVEGGSGETVDPALVPLPEGGYRMYYGFKEVTEPGDRFRILSGVLQPRIPAPSSEE